MKLFGKLGLWIGGAGMLACTTAVLMKLFSGVDMTGNPFLLMGILSAILSVQFFSLGLIGEVCARIYYTHENRTNYQIRNLVNFQTADIISLPRKAA